MSELTTLMSIVHGFDRTTVATPGMDLWAKPQKCLFLSTARITWGSGDYVCHHHSSCSWDPRGRTVLSLALQVHVHLILGQRFQS